MFGECQKCKNVKVPCTVNSGYEITWYYQWVTQKTSRSRAKGKIYNVKFTEKKKIECKVSEMINEF